MAYKKTAEMDDRSGAFLVFEGGDSVGKSTQVRMLAEALRKQGRSVLVTHEPGASELGKQVRHITLHSQGYSVSPRAEALLMAADKAQHVHEVILPALTKGQVVICDRYVDSMLAYQGYGRGLDPEGLAALAQWSTGGLVAHLTILLDVDPNQAVSRVVDKDRMESAGADFHERVRQGFLDLAGRHPQRYLIMPARDSREAIAAGVLARDHSVLEGRKLSAIHATIRS